MAGSSNFTYDKTNPFLEDDVDDETFLGSRPRSYETSSLQERREQLLAEKRRIEQRTLQSSYRSIGMLHASEEIGNATAQELASQREQLENTERKLDAISSSLRTSEKHIQSIKSVFGSIKNYFAGNKNELPPTIKNPSDSDKATMPKSRSELSQILENQKEVPSPELADHPTLRFRSESIPTSKEVDEILDRNLEEMGGALSRLKMLGTGLKDELESQDDLIGRVTRKTENAGFKIEKQNKEMNRILKK